MPHFNFLRCVSGWPGLLPVAASTLLTGCAAVGRLPTLEPGDYQFFRTNDPALAATVGRDRALYVEQKHDSLTFLAQPAGGAARQFSYAVRRGKHVILLDRKFDLDVFTIPFKARPPQGPVPVQLNTNFNAALYFGRRLDFYHVNSRQHLNGRQEPQIRTVGLGYGLFTGLGSTIINPDVTNQQTRVAEYEGFVVHAGAATIYDARIFNLGLAIGFDQLLGPDGRHWLYQRKPWFGVLFGLDLN
ncbi:hypothetical protein J0X19_10170 [Hymenobacter sp. BT186]|uniref:Uncharacterized protein n=1 Tax=Hymenobacter telluris TaxID=2816474 RepID=A0A939EW74_9BACT|nr:hypothetical protein [Hymenobacter telluris]MBO0358309.1 hypothetical protein [Hymenobacter telluris]MBW3374335.1 hypothetical protein [Hymenobacter norwichensis]